MAAQYGIFRHHLVTNYPAYEHAHWEQDPGNQLYRTVSVGDVGYIRRGLFCRLFNVLLPAEDESHAGLGVPEYHEPLTVSVRKHIDIGKIGPNNFCSAKVTSMPEQSERLEKGPDEIPKVTFYCPRKEGAVLSLPVHAKAEDTVARPDFAKWMINHIERWFAWARQLGLGVDRMEEIILVTGTHCTKSCTNVAFPGGQDDAQVSSGAKMYYSSDIDWQFLHERNRGMVLNYGPEGKDPLEDQCIFVRGFRATRRLKMPAGPNPDSEGDKEESDAELMPIPALPEYRDPLHILLEYIAEEAPTNCDMVLVHDDDLARLDGICDITELLDGLQSDVLLSHFLRLKPPLHYTRIDISSVRNSGSTGTESAWVATLSNIFETRCRFHGFLGLYLDYSTSLLIDPGSTPSAPQSFHVRSPLPRKRQARPGLFSVSCASFYVVVFVPSFLIPLPLFHPLPLPSSWSSSLSSPSISFFGLLLLNTLLVSTFSFFLPFSWSLLWDTGRALVEAALRGLENLGHLGTRLFIEACSEVTPTGNLRREVRDENTEEANKN